jgi:hypothetical protein
MSGSILVTNDWVMTTANNTLAQNQSACSLSFWVKVVSSTLSPGGRVWINPANTEPIIVNANSTTTLTYQLTPGTGYAHTYTSGIAYHVVVSYAFPGNEIVYIDGAPVSTHATSSNTQSPGSNALQLGFSGATGQVQIADFAVWNGYTLTSSDALALRNKTSTPNTLGTPCTSWWTLAGTIGNTVTLGDAGIQDSGTGGHNYTTITPTGGSAVYAAALTYTPPVTTTAYLGKSGKLCNFFAINAGNGQVAKITAVSSNPTITWNGHAITPYGPVWTNSTFNEPVVTYSLPIGSVTGGNVTAGGSGYVTPIGTISGGGGSGATCTLTNTAGVITGCTITAGGSGYTSLPTITVTDTGGGTGATVLPFMSGASSSDTLTYTAPIAWYSTAAGTPDVVASAASIANYAGQIEPISIAGVKSFALNPSTDITMPMGVVMDFPPAINYLGNSPFKNWRYRCGNPFVISSGTLTSTPSGQPVTWTGGSTLRVPFANNLGNPLDSKGEPIPLGTWTIVYDDTVAGFNGSNGMSFWLFSFNGQALSTSVDSESGPFANGTRTVNGTTVTIQYNVQRVSNPSNWSVDLWLGCSSPNVGGTSTWTASNLWIFAPGNTIDRSNPLAMDDNMVRWLTSPVNGYPIHAQRWVQQLSNEGMLSCTNASDLRQVTDFSWAVPPPRSINIDSFRYYNTNPAKDNVTGDGTYPYAASPNFYCAQYGYSGSDANGPYIGPLVAGGVGDDGEYLDLGHGGGGNQSCVVEWHTPSPHLLRSHDIVSFPSHAGPPTWGPTLIPMMAFNGTSNVSDGTTNAGLYEGPVYVSGPNTFVTIISNSTGQTLSPLHHVDTTSTTTPVSITGTLNVTVTIPDAGVIPPEFVGAAATQLGCIPWLNVWFPMTDACLLAIAEKVFAYAPTEKPMVVEFCNENWNSGYPQSYAGGIAIGQLLKYVTPGTAIGTYYTTTGSAIASGGAAQCGDYFCCLRTAQAHDIFAGVFGAARIIRSFGVQFENSSHSANYIAFANGTGIAGRTATQIIVGSLHVAAYYDQQTDSTIVSAYNPAGGNWQTDMMAERFRLMVKYNQMFWNYYSANFGNIENYAGPTIIPGTSTPYPGMVLDPSGHYKPGQIAYEFSPESLCPTAVPGFVGLDHDIYYDPEYYYLYLAQCQAAQIGHPYVPGSGLAYANAFNIGEFWAGGSFQQPWALTIWAGQQPGPGTRGVNTVTSQYKLSNPSSSYAPTSLSRSVTGLSAVPQQFSTQQGGATTTVLTAYDITNDAVGLHALQYWIDAANTPTPTPTPAPAPTPTGPPARRWFSGLNPLLKVR